MFLDESVNVGGCHGGQLERLDSRSLGLEMGAMD